MEKIIGYCYVVCDILHEGHVEYFRLSKKYCDVLICGVLTDKATMEKKPQPIMSYKKRAKVVAAIRYVDKVVMQKEYSPLKNCEWHEPDILFESLTHKEFPANHFMYNGNKKVIFTGLFRGQSSTKIKEKCQKHK